MAAARYWRAVALQAYGSAGLELSEFQLLAGTARVDAAATLTSNVAPASGSLANLKDGNTGTGATWGAAAVVSLALVWDFGGSPQDVTDIRLGAGADRAKFLMVARLQSSADGISWTDYFTFAGMAWPGAKTTTASFDPTGLWSPWDKWPTVRISDELTVLTASELQGGRAQVAQSSGVKQFEVTTVFPGLVKAAVGVGPANSTLVSLSGAATGTVYYFSNGQKRSLGATAAYGTTYPSGTVIGVVVDFTAGSVAFYRNGVAAGVAQASGLVGPVFPMAGTDASGGDSTFTLRGRNFAFPIVGASPWEGVSMVTRGAPGVSRGSPSRGFTNASFAPVYGSKRVNEPLRARSDSLTGVLGRGVGRVRGFTLDYVNPLNKPYPCRVRLIRDLDGLLIREQWSKADGSYDFQYVDELQSYTVLAYYLAHAKRAVVTDGLTLANGKVELMA
jgi:hypothetical protein